MLIGVPKESFPGERRVALVPANLVPLLKAKAQVVVEAGAGEAAGFSDSAYESAGAMIAKNREEVFAADVVLTVRCLGAASETQCEDLRYLRSGQLLIGMADPLWMPEQVRRAAATGATVFALELVPRITRAQSMDVLSSQANLAGYKAVLLGAVEMPKLLPMMTTAAGTIPPARTLVVGAGVAGLQAIATAKRLGSVVSGYDVRPEVKQQIESLGARFVELPLDADSGEGGYARQMDEAFYAKQRELMGRVLAESDLVVTTAAIPGKKSPVLITKEMVDGMRPGSIIVDIAAERGGNCELTKPGERAEHGGVVILGPLNLPATLPTHASTLYGKNAASFLLNMLTEEGELKIDRADPIVEASLLTEGGEVRNTKVLELLSPEASAGTA
jgi:NAD(P) transhydrogenase subunit alpha